MWDGDGPIWCAEGPRIRLAGVAARELDGSCRPSHPCPGPSGVAARNTLVGLLGGPRGTLGDGARQGRRRAARCVSEGDGKGGRTAAWCVAPRVGDLSCALVGKGVALRWDRYWRDGQCGGGACARGSGEGAVQAVAAGQRQHRADEGQQQVGIDALGDHRAERRGEHAADQQADAWRR